MPAAHRGTSGIFKRPVTCDRVTIAGLRSDTIVGGDRVERIAGPVANMLIGVLDDLLHDRSPDRDQLRRALDSPIGRRGRDHLQRQLDRSTREPRS